MTRHGITGAEIERVPHGVVRTGVFILTPLLLGSANAFRPAPPTECDSRAFPTEQLQPVRAFPRSVPGAAAIFATNHEVFYWQSPDGLNIWPYRCADKWMFEDHLDQNPPRAARPKR